MTPKKIGRYEILSELGRGGMATVYKAYDPTFEREVALKVLPQELMHDAQFLARFEREAKVIAKLEHAAIVPVYDVGNADGQPYFVMRNMTGGSLADRMVNGLISLPEVARIMQRLCAALDYAHSKKIVHRDLKPGNILFDDSGDPFISDFGIAKFSHAETNLTSDGAIIGTPTYMSPEQARGDPIDARSDQYSMGIILFEMLSGKPPYSSDTPLGLVFKHVSEPVPHILDLRRDLPAGIEPVVEKALAKERDQRFSACSDMAYALDAVIRGETPDLDRTDPGKTRIGQVPALPTAVGGFKLPKEPLWIYILCGVLIVGLIGFFAFRGLVSGGEVAEEATQSESSAVEQATEAPQASETAEPLALGIGGADKIAFINTNNIYLIDVDGANLQAITSDGKPKDGLKWGPDGNTIYYFDVESHCIRYIELSSNSPQNLSCFKGIEFVVGFDISPDSQQIALTYQKELFIVPLETFRATGIVRDRSDLTHLNGCLVFSQVRAENVQWSGDGSRLALQFKQLQGSALVDTVRLFDISNCGSPIVLDEFPGQRFMPDGFADNFVIPSFHWDGKDRFVINTFRRNGGFGELYGYDVATSQAIKINPIGGNCCYRDARISPDGSYLLFIYQDAAQGVESGAELFYIPIDSINNSDGFTSIKLPIGFFTKSREKPQPALRPAQP